MLLWFYSLDSLLDSCTLFLHHALHSKLAISISNDFTKEYRNLVPYTRKRYTLLNKSYFTRKIKILFEFRSNVYSRLSMRLNSITVIGYPDLLLEASDARLFAVARKRDEQIFRVGYFAGEYEILQ